MDRAAQIGEASSESRIWQMPLFGWLGALQDFFTVYWVSLSEKTPMISEGRDFRNGKDYSQTSRQRARIRHIPSKKDVTAEFCPS